MERKQTLQQWVDEQLALDAEPRREKQTLLPSFDADDLAKEVESAPAWEAMSPPPFDPAAYARIVGAHVSKAANVRERRIAPAAPDTAALDAAADEYEWVDVSDCESELDLVGGRERARRTANAESMGREMYGRYLASEFPDALVCAEELLEREPGHALARLVAERCRAWLAPAEARKVQPSSVLRLRTAPDEIGAFFLDPMSEFVLEHVDGVADAATVARLSGIPPREAFDRLHALVDLGVVEVVSA